MEDFEKAIKVNLMRQQLGVETGIEKAFEESIEKGGEGSRGGKVIGHTKSGKPVYETKIARHESKYNSQDHKDAAYVHMNHLKEMKTKGSWTPLRNDHHVNEFDRHINSSKYKETNEGMTKEKSIPASIYKALEDGTISKETFEKARAGIYANTLENKKKGVVGQKYGSTKQEEVPAGDKSKTDHPAAGKRREGGPDYDTRDEEGVNISPEDLAEHAKNASEAALALAIKQSPDPEVRQAAHAELKRRQTEEKLSGQVFGKPAENIYEGGEGPEGSSTRPGDGSKKPEKKKKEEPKPAEKKEERLLTDAEKQADEMDARHRKEVDDHFKEVNKQHAEFDKLPWDKRTQADYDKHNKILSEHADKYNELVDKQRRERQDAFWKRREDDQKKKEENTNREVKKSFTGIKYF